MFMISRDGPKMHKKLADNAKKKCANKFTIYAEKYAKINANENAGPY